MMNHNDYLYLGTVVLIIIMFMYMYLTDVETDSYELEIARSLEMKRNKRKEQILQERLVTDECPIQDLTSPESCFVKSGKQCKWSIAADRCNLII